MIGWSFQMRPPTTQRLLRPLPLSAVCVTRFHASGVLTKKIATQPIAIAISATTTARLRFATTTERPVATIAAMSPPRDSVAARPSSEDHGHPGERKPARPCCARPARGPPP